MRARNIEFKIAAVRALGNVTNGLALIVERNTELGRWEPRALYDRLLKDHLPIPSEFEMRDEFVVDCNKQYANMLFNELHQMLIEDPDTPDGMYDQLDRMHHDFQITKALAEERS